MLLSATRKDRKLTVTDNVVDEFRSGLGGQRFRRLFDLLGQYGLKPLGKSNTDTLLYQKIKNGVALDVFAFRKGSPHVISFPKSYWLNKTAMLSEILNQFEYSEKPATEGHVSESQYSAGQIAFIKNTEDRVVQICRRVCEDLNSL